MMGDADTKFHVIVIDNHPRLVVTITDTHLVLVLTLGHVLVSDLDLRLQHGLEQVGAVDAHEEGGLLCLGGAVGLSLLLAGPLFELHLTEVQDGGGGLVHRHLLLGGEAENGESLLHAEKTER